MRFSLPDLALRRPVTVVMLLITMLILGAVAWTMVPIEFLPRMDFPFVAVVIPYPGSTPKQVENEIAIPAEGIFRTVSNLSEISTTSNTEGCTVMMRFDWETDMAAANAEVRDRIERLKLALPPDADRVMLRHFSSNAVPVMAFGLLTEGDADEFAYLCKKELPTRFLRIPGVADVTIHSRPLPDVLVEFSQDALRGQGLSLYDTVNTLQQSSLNMSIGELTGGSTKYYVRALQEFTHPSEMANLVVGGHSLRLRDVADVGFQARASEEEVSMDGKGGVFVLILKEAEANTVDTCRAIEAELDRLLEDPLFAGVESYIFLNQGDIIETVLNGLLRAGKVGGLFAFLVLFFFVLRVRPTLVVALAIPASLVAAVVFIFFAGMTLNIVTMVALIIAIGMLVDNSIVVTENILRHNQLGHDPVTSARRGASEVALAITAATITTAVVFIPVIYMEEGQMSLHMRQFGAPIIVALAASLVLALTILPLAVSRMKAPQHGREVIGLVNRAFLRLRRRFNGPRLRVLHCRALRLAWSWRSRLRWAVAHLHPVSWLRDIYGVSLAWSMRWRLATLLVIVAIAAGTFMVPFRNIETEDMPEMDRRQVSIEVRLDPSFDIDMATNTFTLIMNYIDELRDDLGIKNVFTHYRPRGGDIEVFLVKKDDLPRGEGFPYTTEEVRDILWQKLPARVPGGRLQFAVAESSQTGEDTAGIALVLKGDDTDTLEYYAERLKIVMEELPAVRGVDTSIDHDRQEMQVRIDRVLADQAGITPLVVARTVDFALRGSRLPYMKSEGREIPVWAQFREDDRRDMANLENVAVMGQTGELIPLSRLVRFERARSARSIRRVNGKNVVNVNARTVTESLSTVNAQLDHLIANFDLPQGYTLEKSQGLEELQATARSFAVAVLFAVILIFIVMGALFESVFLPFSILTTVPLAFIGVYWTLYLTNTPMDSIAYIGCILMVGIIVNNGIVIVDHINTLRREGLGRYDAICQAGRDRFRPVLMTAITTIGGCVPLAIGSAGAEVSFASLGKALIGGLGAGTLLTLFIVPLFYTFIDDLQHWLLLFVADIASIGRLARRSPGQAANSEARGSTQPLP